MEMGSRDSRFVATRGKVPKRQSPFPSSSSTSSNSNNMKTNRQRPTDIKLTTTIDYGQIIFDYESKFD
ncbi:hypothetical protein BLOT_005945 [Blomia tropicalis]|nr:hypothetical protein BLOT_005945 [Blomia tropicalis]